MLAHGFIYKCLYVPLLLYFFFFFAITIKTCRPPFTVSTSNDGQQRLIREDALEGGSRSNTVRIVSHLSTGQHGELHQERHHAASETVENVGSAGMNETSLLHRDTNGLRPRTE